MMKLVRDLMKILCPIIISIQSFYRSFEGIQNLDLIRTTSSNRTNANEMKLYLEAQKDFYKNEKKLNQIPLSLEQSKNYLNLKEKKQS